MDDDLFQQWNQGRLAEQHLATLPPQPTPDEDFAHRASLLHVALAGRRAEKQIVAQPGHPQHQAVADAVQNEQDQDVAAKLASGELVLDPPDVQKLGHIVNARSKIRDSKYLDDEQKRQAIAQTFEDEARIRRSARPIPPEARAKDYRQQKEIEAAEAKLPPEYRGSITIADDGSKQIMRGYSPPKPTEQTTAPTPPPHAHPPQPHQEGQWAPVPGFPLEYERTLPDGTIQTKSGYGGKVEFHEHKPPPAPPPAKPAKPRKLTPLENKAIQEDLNKAVETYKAKDIETPARKHVPGLDWAIGDWPVTRKPNDDEVAAFRAKKLKELQQEYLGDEAQDEPDPAQGGQAAPQQGPQGGRAAAPGGQAAPQQGPQGGRAAAPQVFNTEAEVEAAFANNTIKPGDVFYFDGARYQRNQ
jgi:DNA-binding TFAR19-related protein (PDSD5 family)